MSRNPMAARPAAMIVHAYYEEDPRVRREAESLVEHGRPVDVFALRRPGDAPRVMLDGVQVQRIDVQRHQGASLPTYLREYLAFLVRAAGSVTRAHRRRRYVVVHVHTLPDFLALAGLPLRLAGVPLVLDLHEAMPEFFRMRFPGAANPVAHRLLGWQEQLAIRLASAVITVNDALADRLAAMGVPRDKVTVVHNSPSLRRFDPSVHPSRRFMEDGTLRLVYAGALTPVYELDVLLRAIAELGCLRPDLAIRLDLYGRGDSAPHLRALTEELGIAGLIEFHGRVPIEEIPAAIVASDVGVAPTRRDPFTDFSLSTKIFEYGAMAKPVVASRLPLVERALPDDALVSYEPGDPSELARAITRLVDDPTVRERAVAAMSERVRAVSWEGEAERLFALYDRLIPERLSSTP